MRGKSKRARNITVRFTEEQIKEFLNKFDASLCGLCYECKNNNYHMFDTCYKCVIYCRDYDREDVPVKHYYHSNFKKDERVRVDGEGR